MCSRTLIGTFTSISRGNMISFIIERTGISVWMTCTKEVFSESGTFKSVVGVFVMCLAIMINWSTIYFFSGIKTIIPLSVKVEVPPRFFMCIWISKRLTNDTLSRADTFLSVIMDFWINLGFSWHAVSELVHESLFLIGKVFIFAPSRSK